MRKVKLAGILRLLALVLVVFFVWGFVRDRLSLQNWRVPPEYDGDGLEFIAWIKAAAEWDYVPFFRETSHRLNAPYTANWDDYPTAEKFLIFFLGRLANVIGLFPASNFAVLFERILSAIAFYLCCRLLKYPRPWAFVGAVLFAFAYYHLYRNLGHLHLACTFVVPFAILSAWLVLSSQRMRLGDRFSMVCLGTAIVMGLNSSPYHINMFAQLVGFALLVQLITKRRRHNLKIGFLCLALVVLGFIAINLRSLYSDWAHGKNTVALARNYFQTELYALRPIELLIPPPTHNMEALGDLGRKFSSVEMVKGEMFSPYLGLICIAGLVWMFAEGFVLLVTRRPTPRRFPAFGPHTAWVISYSVIGGINCVIAFAGFQLFRATNRYSIFVSALVLFFLVSRLSTLAKRRKWSPGVSVALAGGLGLFGLFDQVSRPLQPEATTDIAKIVEADQAFFQKVEEALPPGAMIYQLPAMLFPEGPPIRGLSCYNMLRPLFYSKSLRLSFGSVSGRPREAWIFEVEKMPGAQMIQTLEKYGFSAILLNRRAYADNGEEILKQFMAYKKAPIIEDDRHEQVCVLLTPSPQPELPHTDLNCLLNFRSSWAPGEQTPLENRHWSTGDATVSFFSEQPSSTAFSVKCAVGSMSPRRVTLLMKGKELWSSQIPAGQAVPLNVTVLADRGNNKLELRTDEPPARPKDDSIPLAFMVMNLQVTKLP